MNDLHTSTGAVFSDFSVYMKCGHIDRECMNSHLTQTINKAKT